MTSAMVHTWKSLTQFVHRGGTFGIAYLLISLFQCVRLQSLPGQTAAQEVEEHVTQRFQVVPSALL